MPETTAKASRATPQADYRLLSVDDLSGGLDLRKAATLLKANRARVLRNWSLREPGALIVFPGWVSFSTASLGAGRPQGGQRVYLGSLTPFTLAAWNGGVYKPTDGGVWGGAVSTGWSTTNQIYFPHDRDMVVILDGATAPKKSLDGTTWSAFGIAAPGTPTGANLAGGSLVSGNVYRFSYSGRDDALSAEGNESVTVDHTPSGGDLSVRLSLPFHADTQVDTLVVYAQDTTAGEPVRRRVGTVANPPSGSATFDVTANIWGSGVEAPTDHDAPETMSFGVVWKNRWWAFDADVPNRLRFTQIFEPQSWPADFYIDIPFERGDNGSALIAQGDTLLAWGQSRPFLIIGQTSLDFEVRPAGAAQAGALGPRAVDALEEGVIHAAAEGIYLFDGATDRLLSYDIDGFAPATVGWRTYVSTASQGDLSKTAVCYHQASKEVGISTTRLYPYGTPGEWILDLNRTRIQEAPAWTATDRPIGGYIRWDGNEPTAGNRGRILSWSQTIGKLYEERTGTTADGADLTADYHGPVFATSPYVAQFPDAFVEYEPNAGSFNVELYVDQVALGAQAITIGSGLAVYGAGTYGTSRYGGSGRMQAPLQQPLEAEGRTVQARATYVGQAAFRWFTYRLGMIPEPGISGF